MAKIDTCQRAPEVNGELSQLYLDLVKKVKSRPLATLIYADYLQQGVAAQMDTNGYSRNAQNEHSADSVCEFFKVDKMIVESNNLEKESRQLGAIDGISIPIEYDDALPLLNKVQNFNNTHTGLVANIVQIGDKFKINVQRKDSRNQIEALRVDEQLNAWNTIKQYFTSKGLTIQEDETFNPINVQNIVPTLQSLKKVKNSLLTLKDIKQILNYGTTPSQLNRLNQTFGDTETSAQKIYELFQGSSAFTQGQQTLMENAINNGKTFSNLDLSALQAQLDAQTQSLQNSSAEQSVQMTLDQLNKDFGLDINEIYRVGKSINNMAEAAADSATSLTRQLRILEKRLGTSPQTRRIQTTINNITKSIESKQYQTSLLQFLGEAQSQMPSVVKLLGKTQTSGTLLEQSIHKTQDLQRAKEAVNAYKTIVESLVNIDQIAKDVNLTQADKQAIQDQAKEVQSYIQKIEKAIVKQGRETMIDLVSELLGPEGLPQGVSVAELVAMSTKDSWSTNRLYSLGRQSDDVLASLGRLIRDAQDAKNNIINEYSYRIRQAQDKLGQDNSFCYDKDDARYLRSDIDWHKFHSERFKAKKAFENQGFKGGSLKDAMDTWDENNTEDRIVDKTNGRTERVPNSSYRREDAEWDAANNRVILKEFKTDQYGRPRYMPIDSKRQEYYDTIMQLKAELGSMLPKYAQRQYFAPQVRKEDMDRMSDAFKADGIHNKVKGMYNVLEQNIKDYWTIREDDVNFVKNGIVSEGEEYNRVVTAQDNTRNRDIPIFFINPLKDKNEILQDLSTGLHRLAGTAINYDAMHGILDTAEFMADEIKARTAASGDKRLDADVVEGDNSVIIRQAEDIAKATNTTKILEWAIRSQIYGQSHLNQGYGQLLTSRLIQLTSIKSLAANVKGMTANWWVGEWQNLIEAGGGEFMNFEDWAYGHLRLFGDNTIGLPGKMMDFLTDNKNSFEVLLAQTFDPQQENFDEQASKRYHSSFFRKLFGAFNPFLGYKVGEYFIHRENMYSVLHHNKVLVDGKKTHLIDAFELVRDGDNSRLKIKDTATMLDGSPITDEYLETVRRNIRYVNQNCHGSMNNEDKGEIHEQIVGQAAMNFRQWMVGHYSRRFRQEHFESTTRDRREGYWATLSKFIIDYDHDLKKFSFDARLHWKDMKPYQRANIRRVITENAMFACLLLPLQFYLGEPNDHKKEAWRLFLIYQMKQMRRDYQSGTPLGVFTEFQAIIKSPISSINTISNLTYPLYGLIEGDVTKTVKTGRHAGENKYIYNLKKKNLPFYKDIMWMDDLIEGNTQIYNVFNQQY